MQNLMLKRDGDPYMIDNQTKGVNYRLTVEDSKVREALVNRIVEIGYSTTFDGGIKMLHAPIRRAMVKGMPVVVNYCKNGNILMGQVFFNFDTNYDSVYIGQFMGVSRIESAFLTKMINQWLKTGQVINFRG